MMAEAIALYLQGNGIGTIVGNADTFVGVQPSDTDQCVTLYDLSADPDDVTQDMPFDVSLVEIIARGSKNDGGYAWSRDRSWSIHKQIMAASGEIATGWPRVDTIRVVRPPGADEGIDEEGRPEFTSRYEIHFQSTGDAHR